MNCEKCIFGLLVEAYGDGEGEGVDTLVRGCTSPPLSKYVTLTHKHVFIAGFDSEATFPFTKKRETRCRNVVNNVSVLCIRL